MSSPVPLIVTVAEPGRIERQVLQLIKSLRMHGGQFGQSEIWVYDDIRRGVGQLNPDFVKQIEGEGVVMRKAKWRNNVFAHYPLANKIYALADACESAPERLITWLDADIICLSEPVELRAMPSGAWASMRSDARTMIANRRNRPLNWYWKLMYQLADVLPHQYDWSTTTDDGDQVYPFFNVGVVQVRPGNDGFIHAREALERLGPYGYNFIRHELLRYFLEQALLSACLLRPIEKPEDIFILPVSHNMSPRQYRRRQPQDPVCLLHYHDAACETLPVESLPNMKCL